ncbi:MAG: hypothetical protein IKO55_17080 [Kiritimatiellae bacterium]|nr:hypothetical protein [Kiritimatiellia bacterium]
MSSKSTWNRSNAEGVSRPYRSRRRRVQVVPVVVLALLLAAGAWWLHGLWQSERPSDEGRPRRTAAISDAAGKQGSGRRSFVAKAQPLKTAAVQKPEIGDADVFFAPKTLGRIVTWKVVDPPVFTNQFEGFVADVLTAVPGERFLDAELDDEFDKAFWESLKHEIVIDADDSEKVAAMKQAVIEAKAEVRRRAAGGERPRDIVLAARDELNKIADYRDQLQEAFNKLLLTSRDPKEVVKFEQEANALLDEYGACHIDGPHDEETACDMMISAIEEKLQEEPLQGEEKETKR